jgi:hypothetical protein
MAGNIVVSQINGGSIGVINAIINGNFGINQRGVSGTVTLAAGAYGHDRWKAGASGCTYTFATTNNVTTLTISSGSLIQVIEGLNLFDGTYTLSWTGTAQGKIGAGSYAGSGVTGAAVGGTNLNIEFNTGTVSLVQFEQGSVATPFERRPYGTELALCQRYYSKMSASSAGTYAAFASGFCASTTAASVYFKYPTQMRSAPTLTLSNCALQNAGGAVNAATASVFYAGSDSGYLTVAATGQTTGQGAVLIGNNNANAYLDLSSEL